MITYFMKTIEQAVCRQILIEECGYDLPEEHIPEPLLEERQPEGKETASDPSLKDIGDMGEDSKLSKTAEGKENTEITPVASLDLASNINHQETSARKDENNTIKLASRE
jgi:hypothetical protein